MPFQADINNLPKDVQADIDNGFLITDVDDRYQRAKQVNPTTWLYRSGTDDQNFLCRLTVDERESIETPISAEIDVNSLSKDEVDEAICGYYESVEAMHNEFAADEVTMLIAECHFESEIDYLR